MRAAETVATTTRGFDAGKKINGRKRHIAVDTLGLLLVVMISAANLQDRPAARLMLPLLRATQRGIRLIWADGGYHWSLTEWAKTTLDMTVEIVKKIAGQTSCVVLPRRWVVERTFSWICQAAATSMTTNDYLNTPKRFINWSMITMMSRRLTRQKGPARTT